MISSHMLFPANSEPVRLLKVLKTWEEMRLVSGLKCRTHTHTVKNGKHVTEQYLTDGFNSTASPVFVRFWYKLSLYKLFLYKVILYKVILYKLIFYKLILVTASSW